METLANDYPPWRDLPDDLLGNILERLPLSGYARFPAVCRRWLSVQSSHRRRHSPSPPPMLRLPWLISSNSCNETITCYSPFEDRSFAVPFPSSSLYLQFIARGWFLIGDSGDLILFNPISRAKIELPSWVNGSLLLFSHVIAISPPPNYIVSILNLSELSDISLLRWSDSSWTKLELLPRARPTNRMVSCGGKHYCLSSLGGFCSHDLLVVDALASPACIRYFEMMGGFSEISREFGCGVGGARLVEFDGEPLLVEEIVKSEKNYRGTVVGFEVFRADLSRKVWLKMESIGDRVLVLHEGCSVSLSAADVGGKGNCIYFSKRLRFWGNSGEAPWKVFDLGTGRVTDLMLPNASQIEKCPQQLFVPALC